MDSKKEDQRNATENKSETMEGVEAAENTRENINTVGRNVVNLNTTVLLLEDSTSEKFPEYVDSILLSMDTKNFTQAEILSALVFCIALETGYAPSMILENQLNIIKLPWEFSFHKKNVLILSKLNEINYHMNDNDLILYPLILINNSEKKCFLTCVQSGEYLIITLASDKMAGKSITLSIPRYIIIKKRNGIISKQFKNLEELSFLLKEKIFVPIRNLLMQESDYFYYPGLTGIPTEILYFIFKKLSKNDLINLSKTCSYIKNECARYNPDLIIDK